MKYIFIRTANDSAYMNSVSNFRGAVHSADTSVDVYFQSAAVDGASYDKIPLVVTSGSEQTVMRAICYALENDHKGNRSSAMEILADDVVGKYAHEDITSVGALALNTTLVRGQQKTIESVTADDTLTASDSGKTFVFADAAAVLTLPDSGAGDIIGWTAKFISNFQGTGQEVKCADTTDEKIIGALVVADTDDITSGGTFTAEVADSFSSIEITGTTEGEPGSMWTLTCIDTNRWFVEGTMQSAGTSATPFATT